MIVELTREFLDQILALEILCFSEPWTHDAYAAEFMHVYSHTWGWVEGESLVGYLTGWLVFEEFHIANLAVHPDHRRKGIAQTLLDFTLCWAARNEGRVSLLEVRASNEAAIELYRRNGFESVMTRRNYYSNPVEDALILRKELGVE
ncbi:MAG: ribosomal protein S18-alanine N-acetyltransferase [Candidatus Omnitrophica bacterium]|nr:ribosomal protein S18-alanine N-acetyltransferase [Candidatus Omnitrophota bacterium]